MGEYNKSLMIKYTRKALGMTQEELAEFICEPTTLARYESGKIDPTDDKFLRLMKKMGEHGDIFVSPIETNLLELDWEMEQLSNAVEQQEWNVVEKIKQKLTSNRHFSLDYPENKQYLKRIEVILQYHYKKIDETIKNIVGELRAGVADAKPLISSKDNPCTYCAAKALCRKTTAKGDNDGKEMD